MWLGICHTLNYTTIRTAITQRRTARPTTRRTTTQAPVTQAATEGTTQSPGIFGRLGNIVNNGVGNVFNAGLGSNIISTGSLLAAAASPLWAPLLVGKKRRKRSEDVSLNEIQQANMQYYTKLIMSDIEKAKNNYYWRNLDGQTHVRRYFNDSNQTDPNILLVFLT